MSNNAASFDLSGRTALITGSTIGIGFAIAEALASAGANIVLNGIEDEKDAQPSLDTLQSTGQKAWYCRTDLSQPGAALSLYNAASVKAGPIDILISNAAIQFGQKFPDIGEDELDLQFATNFKASLQLTQSVLPHMQAQGWGRVITIGSVQEEIFNSNFIVYAALKTAQTHFICNLAKEYGSDGITFNNIAPGAFDTHRNKNFLSNSENRDQLVSKIPSGRLGLPKDCAGTALLLCSEAGSYINGSNNFIDGGLRL